MLFFSRSKQKKGWLIQSVVFILGCAIVIMPWVITGTNKAGMPYLLIKFYDIIYVRYGQSGIIPISTGSLPGPPTAVSEQVNHLARLHSGIDLPPISINTFPGFIVNQTLHNFVGAFLTLPDSLKIVDQDIKVLVTHPTWSKGVDLVNPQEVPFLILNLVWLALGLGYAWKRWKWAGLSPAFVFSVYSLSLGLGRSSGSRYLVPIDWVVNFYFVLGILLLFQLLPKSLIQILAAEPEQTTSLQNASVFANRWIRLGGVALVICLAGLIPAAQNLVPAQTPVCNSGDLTNLDKVLQNQVAVKNYNLILGKVLYPSISKDNLDFVLFTCRNAPYFEISGFHRKLENGQQILAGLTNTGSSPHLIFIALLLNSDKNVQIIWQEH